MTQFEIIVTKVCLTVTLDRQSPIEETGWTIYMLYIYSTLHQCIHIYTTSAIAIYPHHNASLVVSIQTNKQTLKEDVAKRKRNTTYLKKSAATLPPTMTSSLAD